MNFNCIFCKKYAEKKDIIDLSEDFFAFQTLEKRDEVHYLVCPKKHLEAYFYTNSEEKTTPFFEDAINPTLDGKVTELQKELQSKLLFFAQKLMLDFKIKTGRVIINVLKPYASVGHAHMHVIGHCSKKTAFKNKKTLWFDSNY